MPQPPNPKQIRMMHLVNLMSIAFADGDIADEEKDILINIAQELGLSEEEYNRCVDYWKQTDEENIPIAVPNDDDEQVAFLKHFTLVMMADGEISDNEKAFLASVADQFGYDAEKVIPALVNDVYQEYFSDDEDEDEGDDEEEDDDDEEDEEEEEDTIFEDVDDDFQLDMGKMKLQEKHVSEAFDDLFIPALRNAEAYEYFLIIPNTPTRLFCLTDEQLAQVDEVAQKGYPLALYLLGRYHQVVKPAADSISTARQLLQNAAEAGIPDARWALAMMYLLGYDGPVDLEQYNQRIAEAFDKGSLQAFKQQLSDTIHGAHGNKADPKKAIRVIESFLSKDEEYGLKHPDLYSLLGDAYRRVGNKDKADHCYEQAQDNGFYEAGAHRFENRVEGPDRDFYRESLSVLLEFSCDDNDPNSLLTRALEHAWHYDQADDEGTQEDYAQKLREDLERAYTLGNGDAAYYLGLYHYTGAYGFEKNPREAWDWYHKGQRLESGLAYEGVVRMIDDGVHPNNLPEGYREHCLLFASLRKVGEGQSEEFPTVFIVAPDGKATIYKLEKEEWYKLPHIIGAKRLAPVRLDSLDKAGKKAGFADHLVMWIDIDAPRNGQPQNAIANAFFPGVIAGDVVFSLADNIYDPMPFYGIDEAKTALKAVNATLGDVVTDLSGVSDEKQRLGDYSKVTPFVNTGYVARIEPDGKAYIVENPLGVFALIEEEIYDPARLQSLYDLGKKLAINDRLTMWTDNSALRKQMVLYNKIMPNPIGKKYYPGPVADNVFIALEDADFRMSLFTDKAKLQRVCLALGVKQEDILQP